MEKINSNAFWSRFDSLRSDKGLTIDQVANVCGIKPQRIKEQRSDRRIPTLLDAFLISKALNCSIDYLVCSKKLDNPFLRFIPFLEKADDATIKSVKKLLDMPNPEAEKKADA